VLGVRVQKQIYAMNPDRFTTFAPETGFCAIHDAWRNKCEDMIKSLQFTKYLLYGDRAKVKDTVIRAGL
jgi:hypothetical protein